MKRKQILGMLLAVVMVAGVVGCGKENSSGDDSSDQGQKTEISEEELAEIVRSYDGKFPDPVTVKIGITEQETYQGDETATDNAWFDLYEEYGIDVEVLYTLPAGSDSTEKLQQMIMSGNYPDIMSVSLTDYLDYVEQGLIADITELYNGDYLSDDAKEYFNYDNGDCIQMATVDGKIYGLPQLASSSDQVSVLWIRKDWLDNLGLQVPTTAEEVQEIAKAFTYDDPDGNGQDDTYGFGINGMNVTDAGGIVHYFNMFGAMPRSLRFIEDEGSLIWAGQDEEKMIYGLEMLQQMYADGLINKDFVTADASQLREGFSAGKYGMMIAPMYWLMDYTDDALKLNKDADFIAVPVPSSEVNPEGEVYYPSATISFWCVSSKCENPEVLFKLFNMSIDRIAYNEKRTQEEYEMYCGGKAGVYTGKSLAIIPYLDKPTDNYNNYLMESAALESGNTDDLNAVQLQHYDWEKFFLEHQDDFMELTGEDAETFGLGASYWSVFGKKTTAGYGALDIMIQNDKWLKEAYLSMPTEKMLENAANLETMTNEKMINIIMGNDTPESYSDFLEDWKEKGGQAILDEVNAWYSENK